MLEHIHPQLRSLALEIGTLNEDPSNANQHNDLSCETLVASFTKFGQRKPLVVRSEGMIVEAGNGALRGLRAAGWTHLACVVCDDDEQTATAYALADNQTARLSEWNFDQLRTNVEELLANSYNVASLGWSADGLADILSGKAEALAAQLDFGEQGEGAGASESTDEPSEAQPPAPEFEPEPPIPEPPAEPITQLGEVIKLGPHTLHCADCMDVLAGLPDNSVDSVVCDPPYGLSPDGRARTWDDIAALRAAGKKGPSGGMMGQAWDAGVPGITWARECLRVLKPGGHIVAFSATRTVHRLACAIEDAGFEIRDQIGWVTYQGFPKSANISTDIDTALGVDRVILGSKGTWRPQGSTYAQDAWSKSEHDMPITAPTTDLAKKWDGFGTGIKPALEPAVIARKPLDNFTPEAVADLLGQDWYWSRKALDTDDKREAAAEDWTDVPEGAVEWRGRPLRSTVQGRIELRVNGEVIATREGAKCSKSKLCTVALNVLKWGTGALNIDACRHPDCDKAWPGPTEVITDRVWTPDDKSSSFKLKPDGNVYSTHDLGRFPANIYHCPKPARSERDAGCDELEEVETMRYGEQGQGPLAKQTPRTPTKQRNTHSTVKPRKLFTQLIKLVTPPGGTIFEPFGGSGTTPVAAPKGMRVIISEREMAYCDIIRARVTWSLAQP